MVEEAVGVVVAAAVAAAVVVMVPASAPSAAEVAAAVDPGPMVRARRRPRVVGVAIVVVPVREVEVVPLRTVRVPEVGRMIIERRAVRKKNPFHPP